MHHVGGHTDGLQVVRVHTADGWLVLASDATHYYENLETRRPFHIVFDVDGDVRRLRSRPLARRRRATGTFPATTPRCSVATAAAAPGLDGIVARLDGGRP